MTKSEKLAHALVTIGTPLAEQVAAHLRALQKAVEEAPHYNCDAIRQEKQLQTNDAGEILGVRYRSLGLPCTCFKAEFMRDAD